MGKNYRRGDAGTATSEQPFKSKIMNAPIPPTRNKGKDSLAGKQRLPVSIDKRKHWAAGIIRPGWPGKDNKIPGFKTDGAQRLYRVTFPKKGLYHHYHGGADSPNGKPKFSYRT
jgi:hypothetical protein